MEFVGLFQIVHLHLIYLVLFNQGVLRQQIWGYLYKYMFYNRYTRIFHHVRRFIDVFYLAKVDDRSLTILDVYYHLYQHLELS